MYEEVSFTEDNKHAVLRITNLIDNMEKELKGTAHIKQHSY